jgi:hypothetical protein
MGNTCTTCGDDQQHRELSFKGANAENRLQGRSGNYRGEASVHEYSSKPNMDGRNDKVGPSFAGNKDPNDHQPPSHIATAVTSMNPITAPATDAISKLPRFNPPN